MRRCYRAASARSFLRSTPLLKSTLSSSRYRRPLRLKDGSKGNPVEGNRAFLGAATMHQGLILSTAITLGILGVVLYDGHHYITFRMDSDQDAWTSPKTDREENFHKAPNNKKSADATEMLPREEATLTSAPDVPPPITRDYPVLKYEQWTFNGTVPGPFIRARVGDVVELHLTNRDETGNTHNVDCHAFMGPGGGAPITAADENETKTARFKLLWPGLFVYHCAAAPVPVHIANGMYGLMYVQPAEGDLPAVDREYYVMQSEFYHEPPEISENGRPSSTVEFSYPGGLREEPDVVVFNGSESAVTRDRPLKAKTGESIRIFFGNAGPNLTSSFHILGSNFTTVYRDGDVVSPPGRHIQTVGVPPGGAAILDTELLVPGVYSFVDHAMFRLDKGAVGFLNVSGKPRPDIYQGLQEPAPCPGCKLHP